MNQDREKIRDEFINKEWLHWSSAQSKFVRIPDSSKMEIANYWLTIRQQAIAEERDRVIDEIKQKIVDFPFVSSDHEEMSDKEFKFFKKWITTVVPTTAKNKRGELSKVFRQTLYK